MTLDFWPAPARAILEAHIARHAGTGASAVLDLDHTCWDADLTESLLLHLARTGRLSAQTLDPHVAALLLPGEDLVAAYHRLCDITPEIAFPWLAQAFAGLTLGEIAAALAETPGRPRVYPAMRQLRHALAAAGIEVWAITGAQGDVARALACHPVEGLGLAPERVVGVGLMKRARDGTPVVDGTDPGLRLTAFRAGPSSWAEGKVAAIAALGLRPILIAGDSPFTDGPMLVHSVAPGGLRLVIAHHAGTVAQMRRLAGGGDAFPEGWLEVAAADLH